ncbi:hypothetical protein RL72_00088 [Microbacterium azadirachtae]|uniref:Uncharacterized protein n=1 Tax=Microbacterium azadirachtae TaxID=582680 RepID=A0A0F0LL15_9MICO|nr:hypothetical protein RL72_00088 [Microbacterium azadirachtae]
MSSGYPIPGAAAASSASVSPGLAMPGTVGTPRSVTASLAVILSPIVRMASAVGPMKTMPACSQASAKAAFSARNP